MSGSTNMKRPSCEVLLATYNGASHLPELLDSLDRQTDHDWTLVTRDDGSTDDTKAILAAWGQANTGRLRVLDDERGNVGVIQNFAALLGACEGDYFMLCDQDDVWLPDKIDRLRSQMEAAEASNGPDMPLLVHTDLIVVDTDLNRIADSLWSHQGIAWPTDAAPWKMLAFQNVVTGCAMIGNAALRKASLPIPPEAVMHDWWLALVAGAAGKRLADRVPSALYRQHGTNEIGAKRGGPLSIIAYALTGPVEAVRKAREALRRSQRQAGALCRANRDLFPEAARFLRAYASLADQGYWARRRFLICSGMWFGDPVRNTALFLVI